MSGATHERPLSGAEEIDGITSSTVGDISFSYLDAGTGEPVVLFLHGIGSGARSWAGLVGTLGRAARIVAWDAPGYGGSTGVTRPKPDATDYAVRLALLAEALGLGPVHLVGHSFGAVVAARFAREYRNRVSSLTLVNPSSGHARLPPEERERLRRSRLDDLQKLGPRGLAEMRAPRLASPHASAATRAALVETMSRVHPRGYSQAVETLSCADTAADLAGLDSTLPMQFILGELDVITPLAATLTIAATRPVAPIHVMKGCGHALYLEQPEAFSKLIASFVASPAQPHA